MRRVNGRGWLIGFVALVWGALPGAALAGSMTFGTPTTVLLWAPDGSSVAAYDIVILAEGYTSSQMALFQNDALVATNRILAFEPYKTYSKCLRIWAVNSISAQSGIDKAATGFSVDTCFDCSYLDTPAYAEYEELGSTLAFADGNNMAAAANKVPGWDLIVVLMNDSMRGMDYGNLDTTTAPGVVWTYNGSDMPMLLTRGLGGAVAHLGEERFAPSGLTYGLEEPARANVSKVSAIDAVKWSAWKGEKDASGQPIGCYAGAMRHYQYGIYRPVQKACHMFRVTRPYSPGAAEWPYCPVCREALVQAIYAKLTPMQKWGNFYPSTTAAGYSPFIEVNVPEAWMAIYWWVDGVYVGPSSGSQPYGGSTRYWRYVPPGTHTVKAYVVDNTPWLRTGGLAARPKQVQSWSITK